MPRLRPRLRRAARQPARGLPARHALGVGAGGLGLPRLRGAREAGLHEARRLKPLRGLLLLCALATTSACSTLKFTYNRLDWVATWQLAHFVELDPQQRQLFDERFDAFWRWHRGTQLALYVADLRGLAAGLAQSLAPEQVEQYLRMAQGHVDRAVDEVLPDTARLLRGFDDRQVGSLLAEMAERRAERAEDEAGLDEAERRARAEKRMVRSLKRWVGALTREQERRVHEWSGRRQESAPLWLEYEAAWAAAFAEVLARRHEPDFQARLAALFEEPALPQRARVDEVERHNRAAWVALMADLSARLEPRQRERLQRRIHDLADDLEALTRGMG
jgi:truncated hemoglobin YjbI